MKIVVFMSKLHNKNLFSIAKENTLIGQKNKTNTKTLFQLDRIMSAPPTPPPQHCVPHFSYSKYLTSKISTGTIQVKKFLLPGPSCKDPTGLTLRKKIFKNE